MTKESKEKIRNGMIFWLIMFIFIFILLWNIAEAPPPRTTPDPIVYTEEEWAIWGEIEADEYSD